MVGRLPVLLAVLLGLGPALAAEAILNFDSTLTLREGGALEVEEIIEVRIEHAQVRHGLYRDLLPRPLGSLSPDAAAVRYRIEGAWLDGSPLPWRVERTPQRTRVYLGSPDALAPLGVHRYRLRYRADYASERIGDRGRLVWNVTGNDWTLPIERASVRLRLPPGLDPGGVEARVYLGPLGATETRSLRAEGRALVYRGEVRLPPGSGLTLEARWPLAALPVAAAPADPRVRALAGVLALLAGFLFVAWRRAGRDPRTGAVIPRFRPPEGVSAALAAYLNDRSVTARVFTAALAELAAQRLVEVTGGSTPRLERTDQTPDEATPQELRTLLETLLPARRQRLALNRENAATIEQARNALRRTLATASTPYLRPNHGAALAAGAVAVLTLAALAGRLAGDFGVAVFAAFGTLAYLTLAASALHTAAQAWERYRLIPGLSPLGELLQVARSLLVVFGAPLLAGFFFGLQAGMAVGWLAAAIALTAAWGLYLLPAFTPEGAGVWRQLLGLARYLGTTDAVELRRIEAPEDTPEALRRLYPYAVALGLESAFARRLERYLEAHPEKAPAVVVWRGADGGHGPQSLADVGPGVSRALQAAYVRATSSRSGSGGGGFSGGGSGGGGGGGW